MKHLKIINPCVVAIVAAAITACSVAGLSKITERRDDFNSATIYELTHQQLGGEGLLSATVMLNVVLIRLDSGEEEFNLVVFYSHSDWLFIERGESLILLIDGERVGLTGDGSLQHREVITGDLLWERAWYKVTPDLLRKMANATEIRVRIDGSQYFLERHFTEQNFTNLKGFVARFCPEK